MILSAVIVANSTMPALATESTQDTVVTYEEEVENETYETSAVANGYIASGFVVNDNDAIKDIIKNNQKTFNKNYTDEEIETAITEAKAVFVKKEVVNVDFGKDNSQLSSPVSQSAKQPPFVDKK